MCARPFPDMCCRLWISAVAGFLFLLVFAIFRGKIRVFRTRLVRPTIASQLFPCIWELLAGPTSFGDGDQAPSAVGPAKRMESPTRTACGGLSSLVVRLQLCWSKMRVMCCVSANVTSPLWPRKS